MTHKLLLADDSVTIQRVVELTFSGEDVQVVTVGDGEQAIARIPVELPDIVLADIGMPKRSGYDVAAFVKGRPDLSHIPVLLLAGAFEPVDEARAQQVHCEGVLVKPFEPQQVISRVRDLIQGAKSGKAAGRFSEPLVQHGHDEPRTWRPEPASEAPKAGAAVAAAAAKGRGSDPKFDDYLDRLDAAFAQLAAEPEHRPKRRSSDRDEFEDRGVPTVESLLGPAEAAAPSGAPQVAVDTTEQKPMTAESLESAPGSSEESAGGRNLVADMFAALFAVEQGEAAAPVPVPGAKPEATVSDALVDEVTRRVLQRLAPDAVNTLVAQIVSDVAERLIREEIARIKSAVGARL